MIRYFAPNRVGCIALATMLLAGCTTFSKDGGFNTVSTTASERLGKDAVYLKNDEDRVAAFKRTQELLS